MTASRAPSALSGKRGRDRRARVLVDADEEESVLIGAVSACPWPSIVALQRTSGTGPATVMSPVSVIVCGAVRESAAFAALIASTRLA